MGGGGAGRGGGTHQLDGIMIEFISATQAIKS